MQSKLKSGRMSVAKSVAAGAVAVATLSCASGAMADAVEWRVADGGNGHWYECKVPPVRVNIEAAHLACVASGGSLVSISSTAENAFVFEIARANPSLWTLVWPGATQIGGPWIGARFASTSWQWTDGTAWSFTAWSPGNPNYMEEEHAVLYMGVAGGPPTSQWNNIQPQYLNWGYLIEWSADCNNNGVVDFGEIRNGFAVDTNGNNIPDACECASDPTLAICCPEDIIEDGAVNAIDLAAILNTWGTDGGKFPRADVDGSGTVDGADLAAVLSEWGPCE